jgi:hypothetical protein
MLPVAFLNVRIRDIREPKKSNYDRKNVINDNKNAYKMMMLTEIQKPFSSESTP